MGNLLRYNSVTVVLYTQDDMYKAVEESGRYESVIYQHDHASHAQASGSEASEYKLRVDVTGPPRQVDPR